MQKAFDAKEAMYKITPENILGIICYLPVYILEFQFHIQRHACQAIALNVQYCNHASNIDSRVGGDHEDHSWYNVRRRGIAET